MGFVFWGVRGRKTMFDSLIRDGYGVARFVSE